MKTYHNKNQKAANITKDRGMLTEVFNDLESTQNAYNTLQERGYEKDDINLIMSDEKRKKRFSNNIDDNKQGKDA